MKTRYEIRGLKLTKLEAALEKYEKKRPLFTDADIAKALCSIIEAERAKKFRRADEELISEAVDALLLLSDADEDEISDSVEKVRKRTLARAAELAAPRLSEKGLPRSAKWLIPIAVIISLIAAAGSVSADLKRYEPGTWNERIPSFEAEKREKTGVEVTLEDGTTVIKSLPIDADDMPETLDELYDAMDNEDLLLPFALPDGYGVKIVSYGDCVIFKDAELLIIGDKGPISVDITTDRSWAVEMEFERIGEYDVVVSFVEEENQYYATTIYKGIRYHIITSDKENVYTILNSLEERRK